MARKSPIQIEWERQTKRIERLISRLTDEGITFIRSPIPEQPKRITQKQLSLLRSITKSTLKASAKEEPSKSQKLKSPPPPKKSRKKGTQFEPQKVRQPMSEATKQKLSQKAKERWARQKAEQEAQNLLDKKDKPTDIPTTPTNEPKKRRQPMSEATKQKLSQKAKERWARKKAEQEAQNLLDKKDKPTDIPTTPTPPHEPSEFDGAEPNPVWQIVLEAVKNRIMSANNRNIADYIMRELESEILSAPGGEQEVGMRLFQKSELAIESAEIIMYASNRDDLTQSAYALLSLIYDDIPPASIADTLDILAYEDIRR